MTPARIITILFALLLAEYLGLGRLGDWAEEPGQDSDNAGSRTILFFLALILSVALDFGLAVWAAVKIWM